MNYTLLKFNLFKIKNDKYKIIDFAKVYFYTILGIIITSVLLVFLDKIVTNSYTEIAIISDYQRNLIASKDRFGHINFLYILLIGPFLEELIFRLPLDFKLNSLAISFSLLFFRFSGTSLFDFSNMKGYFIRLIFTFLLGFIIVNMIPKGKYEDKIKKHKTVLISLSIILFGFVHISNYSPLHLKVLYLYPIFVLPQIIMGISITHLRLKYGFWIGLMLHFFLNLLSVLLK